ncbi:MAG: SusD/RagB family nutrient-binding outer membrane lipoprotein [Ekhidna sp.]|nr:SusD/RagB family nutrient-binding outer membrane lipoprotein [Ekhidna sp.]
MILRNINKKALEVLALVMISFSCDLEEVNVNPNNAETAPLSLRLPVAQVNAVFGIANTAQFSSIWTQQLTGTLSDFEDVTNYRFLPGFSEFTWSSRLYAGAMIDLNGIITEADASGATHISGVARIIMAMCLGHLVDTFGDVPYTQAFDPVQFPQPGYDNGSALYTEIQSLLDQAISDLNSTSTFSPTNFDLIYPQSSESEWVTVSAPLWIKTANALRARYYIHLTKVDATDAAQNALTAINAGAFVSNDEDAKVSFGPEQAGPWFGFFSSTFGQNNIALCQTFVDLLKNRVAVGVDDPRAAFYFSNKVSDAVTYGSIDKPAGVNEVGPYLNTLEAPTNLITYTEVKFIEAEAHFRLGQFDEAASAFNEAVISSIVKVTGDSDAVYEAAFASEDATSIQTNGLEKIFTEKHIALFLEHENWVDWRRSIPSGAAGTVSGIPSLTPSAKNETGGAYPRRFLYPQSEVANNSNTPSVSITDKVFWDN